MAEAATRHRAAPFGYDRWVARGPSDTYLIERDGVDVTVTAQDRTADDTTPYTHRTGTPLQAVIFCEGVALGFTAAGYDVASDEGACTRQCREHGHG